LNGLPFEVEYPEDTEFISLVIYGDTGVGKTYFAGTVMEVLDASPALLVDFEGGTRTLHGMKIDVTRPRTIADIQEIYDYFFNDNNKYKTIIIDPLTEAQKISLGHVMGEVDTEQGRYKNLSEALIANRGDWLRSRNQMEKVIKGFRSLAYTPDKGQRVHVIMTARERFDEKKSTICPQLPGVLGLECGAFVDILARLSVHQVVDEAGQVSLRRHLLLTQYRDDMGTTYLAKNRGGRLGRQMWDPNFQKILKVWQTEVSENGTGG
jgi:hypothetical protein